MCIIDPSSIFACATLGCGVLSTAYLASNINKIPHPSECGLIGRLCLMTKIHSHEPLELTIKFKNATSEFGKGNYFIEVVSGRFKYATDYFKPKNNELVLNVDLPVHLRQCDDHITINLYKHHLMKNKLWGTLKLTLDNILNIPRQRRYTLEGSPPTHIFFSINRFGSDLVEEMESPLKKYALIELQNDGEKDVQGYMSKYLNNSSENKKLRFYSSAVSGELEIMNDLTINYKEFYFKAIELTSGYWVWCYWKNREDYKNKKEEKGYIPIRSISLVKKDRKKNDRFYVRYQDMRGYNQEFFAKSINRDRNSWVDCLNEFIQMARTVFENTDRYQLLKLQLNSEPNAFKKVMGASPRFKLVGLDSGSSEEDYKDENPDFNSDDLYNKIGENSDEEDLKYPDKSEDSQYTSLENNILKSNIKFMESNLYRQI
ncbi:uncharacterized protein TA12010 [Theileria annulata]|uniref:PH domain-containing protein n=1 Tax=Theileria annulata TaxID=5874 RepID=Q4UDT0_THEAN|nr:uncharacterized protein TA12010 [Theileria annulata]CAI74759.1 hypothetical protein TA12010 [Theileria annulata]|eukprot:XP_952491.1 hypothetical protein TA12010 [Theileria annulata]